MPPRLLSDPETAVRVERGLEFATKCDRIIKGTFLQYFGGGGKDKRHRNLKDRLSQAYWEGLAPYFHDFIQSLGQADNPEQPYQNWLDMAQNEAINQFAQFAQLVGSDAASLRERVQAIGHNRAKIYKLRKEQYPQEASA